MPFRGEEKIDAFEDSSFVVELLNGRGGVARTFRPGEPRSRGEDIDMRETERFMREMAAASEVSDAVDELPVWDDGGEYARAAEAAGVDVGGMLEAGVNAKKILHFVSDYRKAEGDQLRLLDNKNLKFASSQILQKSRRAQAGREAINIDNPAVDRHSSQPASLPGASTNWPEFSPPPAEHSRSSGSINQSQQRSKIEGHNHTNLTPRDDRRGVDSARDNGAGHPVLGEDDGAETARLCSELLRWGAAIEGTKRERDRETNVAGARRDGLAHRMHRVREIPSESTEKSGEGCNSSKASMQGDGMPGNDHPQPRGQPADKENHTDESELAYGDDHVGQRRGRRRPISELTDAGDRRGRNSGGDLDDNEKLAEWNWAQGEQRYSPSPGRHVGGLRSHSAGQGQSRPTPSYALPTKHFKTLGRDHGNALVAEEAQRQRQLQRKVQLDEENSALKLRLAGQRRAIHELEHQANTLREEAREREEGILRLKRRLATSPTTIARGTCSCCASTHHNRARPSGDTGAMAIKKRAVAAEARARELERSLAESRAKEQRAREIGASLKYNCSGAQDKATGLEAELASAKKALLEARREVAESHKGAKANVKIIRKYRRQQDEISREAEIARAEATDLAAQLRKALKELHAARIDLGALRREKSKADERANDLVRENEMLQDRLRERQLRRKTREPNSWVMPELHSESRSPGRIAVSNPSREHCRTKRRALSRTVSPRRSDFADSLASDDKPDGRRGGTGRRRRLGDAALRSPSAFESRDRSRGVSHSPDGSPDTRNNGLKGRKEPFGRKHDGPRADDRKRGAGGQGSGKAAGARGWSTMSANGADDGNQQGRALGSSTLSVGSNRSTMGARYERLQAMYRRVNRTDTRMRRRAGVG